jgi:hypothetical protein
MAGELLAPPLNVIAVPFHILALCLLNKMK